MAIEDDVKVAGATETVVGDYYLKGVGKADCLAGCRSC